MSLILRPRRNRSRITTAAKFNFAKKLISAGGKAYRSYKSRYNTPSRLRVSRTRNRQTTKMTSMMRNVSGSKYQGYSGDCLVPKAKPAGTQPINYIFMNTGKDLTAVGGSLANYVPQNLFSFPQGIGNDQRLGDYMFLRNTHLKFEIQTLPYRSNDEPDGQQPIIQYRFMIVKSNRKYDSLGVFDDPGNSLFLDTQNDAFGYGLPGGTSTSSTFLNFGAPINKRDWLVYCDKRFKLSAPSVLSIDRQNSFPKYNTKKYISINLPSNKKSHFKNSPTDELNVPNNFDTQWLVIVQAVHGSYCTTDTSVPKNWTMNVTGTTSAYDN